MYIDIHCHESGLKKAAENKDVLSFYCHAEPDKPLPAVVKNNGIPICVGFHPWYLPETFKEDSDSYWEDLKKWKDHPQFFTLGECGLDRVKGPSLEVQKKYLIHQLEWAHECQFKVIVFHCVKTLPDIINILKASPYQGLCLWHDYHGNREQTAQLLKDERHLFSLGQGLFQESAQVHKSLELIPLKKVFLETDDHQRKIQEVYEKYSDCTDYDVETVKEKLLQNAQKYFPNLFNKKS